MSLCLMSTFIREVPGYTSFYVVIGVSTLATIAQTNLACKIQTPTYYTAVYVKLIHLSLHIPPAPTSIWGLV